MTDWLTEAVTELQAREAAYRDRVTEEEYWNAVANGLSEALDVLDEVDRQPTTADLEGDDD